MMLIEGLPAGRRAATSRLAVGLLIAAIAMSAAARAQGVSTTTVQGTVYLASGEPGAGTLVVSWPAFTTAAGQVIAADSLTAAIAADGFVSVSLAPNLGSLPAGEYYTAVYYMSDGTSSTEYWVVPAASTATIAQVRAQVMPAAQAVQAVSKSYVDDEIAEATGSVLTPLGGVLTGPLYLSADPTQPLQAADKHYVDTQVATDVPLAGGTMTGTLTLNADPTQAMQAADKHYVDTAAGAWPALVLRVDEFTGADFGAQLQACVNAVNTSYGGTCDARNFSGSLAMGASLTIAKSNTSVLLPCATIATANQIIVAAGTRNVALHGCALRGGSAASGSTGGTAFAYSGASAMIEVGDSTYATDTPGFHMDNAVINTTAATSATAQAIAAYRTQELDLESLYLLGNANQTGMTLDGTGNYTGGTFLDDQIDGFQTAVNAIGHQAANLATTDWVNASTFVRIHIDCPTSGGIPIAGTYGINLQQGDGNTFTGGDVEGCATALHLGTNAQNNTIVGLRNENSTNQVVADAGSSYNNWTTGGTMFTGKLTDNGTRNSFFDTFHRSFNGLNGDWYGSQQDATVTNHYRLGIGAGNERGLQDEYQTDYGYRWEIGPGDGTSGEQFYNFSDLLNNVQRIGIGQYLSATPDVVTNVIVNSGGCYSSSAAPTIAFSGGGGSGASATANMTTTASLSCPGGYTVASVAVTSGGSGYTSQPALSFTGGNQTAAPNAIAEIATAGSTNNQTVINSAGTGAVVLNGSSNAGTGGVVFGSGGSSEATVATVSNAGNAEFNGTLQVGGTAQSAGTMTVRNNADAEVDYYLWPGLTTSQKGSFTYKDWNGNSQWYMLKDASNNWALNSAVGGLDSLKAYQSSNSGDTYIDASNSSGVVRVNYESGAGTQFKVYGGNSSALYASFTGTTSIAFPGLAASSGHNCLQIDNSGYITNTGWACGSGSGTGTVGTGSTGQIAYYTGNGTTVGGMSAVPLTAGGTGATSASSALSNLGALPANGATSTGSGSSNAVAFPGALAAGTAVISPKIGPVYQADQYTGSDPGAKINACIAAAIAAGGGTCDARNLTGTQAFTTEVQVGTSASEAANIGVTLLLPASATWQWNISDGVSCGIEQWGSTVIKGDGSIGGGNRMTLTTANSSVDMDSLYCNASNSGDTSWYYKASDFLVTDSNGGMLRNGAVHVTAGFDGSTWENIAAATVSGNDAMHVDSACCHAAFRNIWATTGYTSTTGNANPLRIGDAYPIDNVTLTASNCTLSATNANFTRADIGKTVNLLSTVSGSPALASNTTIGAWTSRTQVTLSACPTGSGVANLSVTHTGTDSNLVRRVLFDGLTANGNMPGGYNITILGAGISEVTIFNAYLEGTSDNQTFVYNGAGTDADHFIDMHFDDDGNASKYAIENHAASAQFDVIRSSAGINDLQNAYVAAPDAGTAPYSMVTTYSTSRGIYYQGAGFVWNNGTTKFGLAQNDGGYGLGLCSTCGIFGGSTASGTTGNFDVTLYRGAANTWYMGTANIGGDYSGNLKLTGLNAATAVASASVTAPDVCSNGTANGTFCIESYRAAGTNLGAWSSTTAYTAPSTAGCEAVTYSGTVWMSMTANTNVTPGSSVPTTWMPALTTDTAAVPTAPDCAFYAALAYAQSSSSIPVLKGERNTYVTNVGWNMGNSGTYGVALSGIAQSNGNTGDPSGTTVQAGEAMTDVVSHQSNGSTMLPNWSLFGWTADANHLASHAWTLGGLNSAVIKNIGWRFCIGTDYCTQFGSASNDNSASWIVDNYYEIDDGNDSSSWAQFSVSQSGGVPSVTVSSGGSYYWDGAMLTSLGLSASALPLVLKGNGAGVNPCTTMPTSATLTWSGAAISAVTLNGASGCSGTMTLSIPDLPPYAYGLKVYIDDSYLRDGTLFQGGQTAALWNQHPDAHYTGGFHVKNAVRCIQDNGSTDFDSVEFDGCVDYGDEIVTGRSWPQKISTALSTWNSTHYPGSEDFHLGSGAGLTLGRKFCGQYDQTGYNQFESDTSGSPVVLPSGTVTSAQQCQSGGLTVSGVNGAPTPVQVYSNYWTGQTASIPQFTAVSSAATLDGVGVPTYTVCENYAITAAGTGGTVQSVGAFTNFVGIVNSAFDFTSGYSLSSTSTNLPSCFPVMVQAGSSFKITPTVTSGAGSYAYALAITVTQVN